MGEKNIFNELTQIVSISAESNSLLLAMFKMDYREEQLTQAMHNMQFLEKKSDEIAFKIDEDITGGAISPNVIDNLLQCVQVADNIVDTYYYLSRELARMAKAKAASAGFEMHSMNWDCVYEEMLTLAEKALLKLKQALSSADIGEILQLRKEIEDLEEQADDVKDQGFDRLYSVTGKMNYLEFFHFQELLHKCDDVLDSCEDFSDLIVSVVTSILK